MRADAKREAMFGVVPRGGAENAGKASASVISASPRAHPAPATLPPLRETDIHLGDSAAGAVGLDLGRLVAHRMLIQANSGAGKSYLLRRLIEQAWGRVQQLAIDPDGELVTLTEKFDIAILTAADVQKKGARAVAAHLRQHRYSAVLDLSDAVIEDRMALVAEFVAGLVEAAPEHWHPLLVIVDEAQTLAPHYDTGEVEKETKKRCVAALADMMGRGRKRGLAGIISTTRLAETAMAVKGKAGNIVIGRTPMDVDLNRAGKLLGYTAGGARPLATLGDGEFVALGPAIAGGRRVRFKGGPVQTTHKGATPDLTPPPAIAAASVAELVRALPDAPPSGGASGEARRKVPQGPAPARKIYVVNGVRGWGWSAEEDEIVRKGYAGKKPLAETGRELEAAGFRYRGTSGISMRAKALGAAGSLADRAWKPDEDEIIRRGYASGVTLMNIVANLGAAGSMRSRASVQMRAMALGITRDRVNYWTEKETEIAIAGLRADKPTREIIADLKRAGFHRGVTAISTFRQKHGFGKPHDAWTEADDAILRRRYDARVPVRAIAAELGRPMHSITTRAHRLGIKQRTAWGRDEERILVEAHERGERLIDAAERIGRPYANVAAAAKRMGLSFRAAAKAKAATARNGSRRGRGRAPKTKGAER